MSMLVPGGKSLTLLACLVLLPSLAVARSHFSPAGAERIAAGQLRADQTMPQAAISHTGGYLVWQDNAADRYGLGVRAQALDASGAKSGPAFRVNVQIQGDQQKPQVSLLNDGGAVFVWQGGRAGFQKIFARFLSSSGLFVTGDVRANTYTNGFQVDPAVATLADGSVVVVWASSGQDGSLQGIYAQRFTALGAKLGGEFQVNQYTPNNQRTPAIAALTNGNYVVAWVSELQRSSSSVDVFARIFSASGAAVTGEFPVNLSVSNLCANPSIAASRLGGGFAVAWSQNDNTVAAVAADQVPASTRSSNSWDVFARLFGATGTAVTGLLPLNTTTYGDQYAPRIKGFGTEYVAVWTALGLDGSREGVFGRFLDADGSPVEDEFRVNTTTVSRQMHPALASDDHSQVLAVWTSFGGGANSFDLFAQRFTTEDVIPLELLANGVPQQGGGSAGHSGAKLAFPTVAVADEPSLPDAFATAAGTFNGLFCEKDGMRATTSGSLSAKLTSKGAYTGKLLLAGRSYSIRGTLDETGWAASVIARVGLPPLTVYLQLDLAGGERIQGGVTDGDWWAELLADRAVFNKSLNPTARAGKYTLVIPGRADGAPAGDGFGTVSVHAAGSITFAGTLADGTKVTQKGALTREGYWPLYVAVSKGAGAVVAWIQFNGLPESDLTGPLVWIKPADAVAKISPSGFTSEATATGSRYTAPASGQRILNWSNGSLTLTGGNLAAPLTGALSIDVNNKVAAATAGQLSLKLTASTGLFKGTMLNSASGRSVTVQGVLVQKTGVGSGFFLGTSESGRVTLQPIE